MSEQPVASPFHEGEREIQTRLGVRDQLEDIGQRFIRSYMPDEHREFYGQLPYLLIGSIDESGRPWASIMVGRVGFVRTLDKVTLSINTPRIQGDPLNANVGLGSPVGVLGIQYDARRRNRLTGKVVSASRESLEIRIDQAFGNCPQYIQAREPELLAGIDEVGTNRPIVSLPRLNERAKAIVGSADHFFIATHYSSDSGDVAHGADVSHRGGKPGFVRIEDDRTLTFPDFTGNSHFNTLGNIAKNPRAGLLFIDFDSGDLLYLTCSAEIIWDGEEKRAFNGAERLVRFTLDEGALIEGAMPIRWRFIDYSPSLDQTGSWEEASDAIAARTAENVYRSYRVARVERESEVISSFYLEPADSKEIGCHQAGQFLPVVIAPSVSDQTIKRTYSISNAPSGAYYRLSIKREPAGTPDLPPGLVSNYFHDEIRPGSLLEALPPRGQFVLCESSTRPVVLLSAGVGITPMISMLEQLTQQSQGCGCSRQVWFLHGARDGNEHAFRGHVQRIVSEWSCVTSHIVYSAPNKADVQGEHYDSVGRIDFELVKKLLPLDDYDFYFCGPTPFMQSMYRGLKDLNVRDERIHYEFFGPGATLLEDDPGRSQGLVGDLENPGPVTVRFARSNQQAIWDPSKGTLLELAESMGLRPAYSCRSGICGTCETSVESGQVAYTNPPLVAPPANTALICCSYPTNPPGNPDQDLVLDL
jgi:ferredoxin-NADP reductase/predicted pyridoxine 5'-phosphate oxidase superfamily flavin-nucleotide-binding protein